MSGINNDVKDLQERTSMGFGWLDKVMSLIERYGTFRLLQGLCVMFLTVVVVVCITNPGIVVDSITTYMTKDHDDGVSRRMIADVEIRALLQELRQEIDADRVYVIELHNGNSNLASGLPFVKGDMRIEEVSDSTYHVDMEYHEFSLSTFPFVSKLFSWGSFGGSVGDLEQHDKRLYYKFLSNDVDSFICIALFYGKVPLGVLGATWCHEGVSADSHMRIMRGYSTKVSSILSDVHKDSVQGIR